MTGASTAAVDSEVSRVVIAPCYARAWIVASVDVVRALDSSSVMPKTRSMNDSPDPRTDVNPRIDAKHDGRDETRDERADRNWEELMQELRVMQTGTQVLSGFLLAVAFTPRFTELDDLQRTLYIVLVGLATVATVLALTPVGMHRSLFGRHRKPDLVRFASRMVQADLVVIGVLSVGVTTLIVDFTVDRTTATVVLIVASIVVLGLWVLLPRLIDRR
jgi:hypothetical protein